MSVFKEKNGIFEGAKSSCEPAGAWRATRWHHSGNSGKPVLVSTRKGGGSTLPLATRPLAMPRPGHSPHGLFRPPFSPGPCDPTEAMVRPDRHEPGDPMGVPCFAGSSNLPDPLTL